MEEKRKTSHSRMNVLGLSIMATLIVMICIFMYEKVFAYRGWQTVSVHGVGTFQVPGDWVVTQYDNVIWLTDKAIDGEGCVVYFAGVIYNLGFEKHTIQSLVGDFAYRPGRWITGGHYAGGKMWALLEISIGDEFALRYTINFGRAAPNPQLSMIAWDSAVSQHTIILITRSFELEKGFYTPKRKRYERNNL